MTKLAGWLLSLFTTIATFFAARLGRRASVATAGVVLFVSLTAAFLAAMKVFAAGIVYSLNVPDTFLIGWAALAPSNLEACIAAMFGARLLAWAYNLNKDIMGMYLGGI